MGVLPPPPPGSTKLNQAGEGDGFPRRSTKRSAGCLCISASFSGRSRCVLRLASRVNTNCGEFASADRRPPPASRQGINCKRVRRAQQAAAAGKCPPLSVRKLQSAGRMRAAGKIGGKQVDNHARKHLLGLGPLRGREEPSAHHRTPFSVLWKIQKGGAESGCFPNSIPQNGPLDSFRRPWCHPHGLGQVWLRCQTPSPDARAMLS